MKQPRIETPVEREYRLMHAGPFIKEWDDPADLEMMARWSLASARLGQPLMMVALQVIAAGDRFRVGDMIMVARREVEWEQLKIVGSEVGFKDDEYPQTAYPWEFSTD